MKKREHRSLRTRLSEETIRSSSNTIEILFPDGRTRKAAFIFIEWLKDKGGQASKNAVSQFANSLQIGKLEHKGVPFRYSRRNFYMTILKTFVDMGFVQRNVPVWDRGAARTLFLYQRNFFDIPQKPPSVGFWRLAYYICKKWNDMFIT